MFREEFELGGPLMYVIFAVWVLVLALVLERLLYWLGRRLRRRTPPPGGAGREPFLDRFLEEAEHNHSRIDGLSHLATSLGLFGTVFGISKAFFARGAELSLAAPEVLASGMATALFTTVAGLAVFLVGQTALVVFRWWTDGALRKIRLQAERAGPR